VLLDPASGHTGALVQAFAAGALLAMLADTLLPEAYKVEGILTGRWWWWGSRSPWRCQRLSEVREWRRSRKLVPGGHCVGVLGAGGNHL
jgi:hypothetical protein